MSIPDEVRSELLPVLAPPGYQGPAVYLPCGLALKFQRGEEDVTWEDLTAWGVPRLRPDLLGEIAGMNAISYIQWPEVEPGVYENDDSCWPELVLAPATFIEHNAVEGTQVVYVVSERKAILTGSDSAAGRARIRAAMPGGLADSAMVLNWDRRTWSRFYVHDATAFRLARATVTGRATGEARYREGEHYGHVLLEVSAYPGPLDFLLVWAVGEAVIPSEYREAVRLGCEKFLTDFARENGPLAGLRIAVVGGSFHEVNSKAASYQIAAAAALERAVSQMRLTGIAGGRQERDADS